MSFPVANGPPGTSSARQYPLSAPAMIAVGATFLAVLLTVTGAYGTRDLTVLHRLLLWGVVGGLLLGQVYGLAALAERRRPMSWPTWMAPVAALVATTPLLAAELHLLKFSPLLPKAPDPFVPFMAFVAPPVLLLGGLALYLLPDWRTLGQPSASPLEVADSDVRTVRAHDHYLEVRTALGRRFVRGAFSDYVGALGGGLQTHRSWWIAVDQIERLERRGRDHVVVLTDGSTAPIARSRLDAVRDALRRSPRARPRVRGTQT